MFDPIRVFCAGVAAMCACSLRVRAAEAPPLLASVATAGDVQLVTADRVADVYVSADDFAVVRIAAGLLADDVQRVTGRHPFVQDDSTKLSPQSVIIGTIGTSPVIDRMIAAGLLDVTRVRGRWETFVIATVERPMPNVDRALVVAGSDRRGTAYGALEMSEQIGVSPWYWWADATPAHRDTLAIKAGTNVVGPPSVKYRGIFINDEDWGLTPWASKTFEPERGNIGPKTYAKVFELMLRLKANYLWPAMHPCSTEFGKIDENLTLADDWGIVMGASHAEPMNRNNVRWNDENRGPFRYDTNRGGVLSYWDEWAKKRGPYEAVWTVGMRGIHDSGMNGPADVHDQARLLGQAIADQRTLLSKYVAKDPTKSAATVPQAFMPYKEVLAQYEAGLEVPDDVTLVWCDDNYGYLRQLSTPQEQKRSGRAGVYYHISYLGKPQPYLWVNSTPPALIWQQMQTALAYGADRVWVLNVGDIKPGEIGMEFWTKLAWNAGRWNANAQDAFLTEFAAREFGIDRANEVAGILNRYYDLSAQRKPELSDRGVFSMLGDAEGLSRIEDWTSLQSEAEQAIQRVPAEKRDAYFELVLYPIRVAAETNLAILYADESRLAASQQRPAANGFATMSLDAKERLKRATDAFNHTIVNGKWNGIMTLGGFDFTGEYAKWTPDWAIHWPTVDAHAVKPTIECGMGVLVDGRSSALIDGKATIAPRDDVEWPIASQPVAAPWMAFGDGEARVVGTPNGSGDHLAAATSPSIAFDFTIAHAGTFHVFGQVIATSNKDDSFFLRVDDGPWITWNDWPATPSLAWREQGTHQFDAGKHTLRIALREDGAMIHALRLTQRDHAEADADVDVGPASEFPTLLKSDGRSMTTFRVFHTDGTPATDVQLHADQPWIDANGYTLSGPAGLEQVCLAGVQWDKLPPTGDLKGTLTVTSVGKSQQLVMRVVRPPTDGSFAEVDGVVSMEAEHFTRAKPVGDVAWAVIPHLGRSGDGAMTIWPPTAQSVDEVTSLASHSPSLEYDFTSTSAARDVTLHAYCLPTYRIHAGRGVRYAVAIDNEKPQIVDFSEDGGGSGEHGEQWSQNKLRNISITATSHPLGSPGKHTLRLWMVDPGVVVDKLVLDLGGARPSELGPVETLPMR